MTISGYIVSANGPFTCFGARGAGGGAWGAGAWGAGAWGAGCGAWGAGCGAWGAGAWGAGARGAGAWGIVATVACNAININFRKERVCNH